MTMCDEIVPDSRFGLDAVNDRDGQVFRVVLADHHLMILEMLADALSSHGAMRVEVATSVQAALQLAQAGDPVDLILLDHGLPDMAGLDGLRRAVSLELAPVAVIAGTVSQDLVDSVQSAGGRGLLGKSQRIAHILGAVRELCNGGQFYAAPDAVPKRGEGICLNCMETKVVQMIALGMTNAQIGDELGLPLSTVKMHVRAIFRRLKAVNRTDAVRVWQRDHAAYAPALTLEKQWFLER